MFSAVSVWSWMVTLCFASGCLWVDTGEAQECPESGPCDGSSLGLSVTTTLWLEVWALRDLNRVSWAQ